MTNLDCCLIDNYFFILVRPTRTELLRLMPTWLLLKVSSSHSRVARPLLLTLLVLLPPRPTSTTWKTSPAALMLRP